MSYKHNLKYVDGTLRSVTRSDLAFCGKAVLLIGDFHQILPGVRQDNRSEFVSASFKHYRSYILFKGPDLY